MHFMNNKTKNYVLRAHSAMRRWGDEDRDDDILEGACQVDYLANSELVEAAKLLAALEAFCKSKVQAEFLPALLAEALYGRENLAAEYGITIPANATQRRVARSNAVRSLAA